MSSFAGSPEQAFIRQFCLTPLSGKINRRVVGCQDEQQQLSSKIDGQSSISRY